MLFRSVARIATLARIKVPEADREALGQELNKILDWVEQLGQVDTTGVEPMTSVAASSLSLPRASVFSGDATISKVSLSASPIVFVPRSRPRSRSPGARQALSSVGLRIGMMG